MVRPEILRGLRLGGLLIVVVPEVETRFALEIIDFLMLLAFFGRSGWQSEACG